MDSFPLPIHRKKKELGFAAVAMEEVEIQQNPQEPRVAPGCKEAENSESSGCQPPPLSDD